MNLARLTNKRPILFVIGSADVGGAEKQLVRLARELAVRGVMVEVAFTQTGGPLTAELDAARIAWRVFSIRPRRRPLRTLIGVISFAGYLLNKQPLVINAWLSESTVISLILARIFSQRSFRVASVRGEVQRRSESFESLLGRILRSAHAILGNGPHLATFIVDKYRVPMEKIKIIPNGVEIPLEISDVSVQPPVAVVVANFHSYKGHLLLLEALANVSSQLRVRFCGSGAARSAIAEEITRLNLGAVVALVDEPADIRAELKAAQFAIHPSTTEGMSNAILEEMASGLPVIAFDIAGNIPLISHNENGLLVEESDAAGLTAAIELLAHDAALRGRLSTEARKRAIGFSWDASVARYEAILTELISANHSSGRWHRG